MRNKTIILIQARLGSTRFPKKILQKIGNKTVIEILYNRIRSIKLADKIIIVTTKNKTDDVLVNFLRKKKITVFRGSEKNVLKRFYDAGKKFYGKFIVRICGDCPFVEKVLLEKMIKKIKDDELDYVSNINPPTYPDGLDLEVFTFKALSKAYFNSKTEHEKEHVTPYIIKNMDKNYNFKLTKNYSKIRVTLDEKQDLENLRYIFKRFNNLSKINLKSIIQVMKNKFKINNGNYNLGRNAGSSLNKGQKLWRRAINTIPGGNMLLSKRPEMFLPNIWPTYFSKSSGCNVWDLDGKKYIDLATMSVGTNILGYRNKKVDKSVIKSIKNGNMSSLNCPEEVFLSEKLIDMHKHFDMVKFAKSGGEANAIAIRIARAHSKKDNVAICGYHGWHDWYLSANLSSVRNLNNHLLPGLSAHGVPKKLKGTVFPFEFNDIKNFYSICKNNNIGVVKMEVYRNFPPKNNFLKKVRSFCSKNKIILIFDECTSGFRETYGGLHLKYNVIPDICILGKALGNGYPINAIIGKRHIMQSAQSTFISSTFWTERTGYVAALKALEEMERVKSWRIISKTGRQIKENWLKLSKKHKLKINISGLDALPSFSINSKNWLKYKSFITLRMLENSILASNIIFVSIAHSNKILKKYFKVLDKVFREIKNFEENKNIYQLNKIPLSQTTFKRLN